MVGRSWGVWSWGGGVACLLLAGGYAHATPAEFTYIGELRAANGLPFEGAVEVGVELFGSMAGADSLWEQAPMMTTVEGGVLELGLAGSGLNALFASHDAVWAEFTVDGQTLEPRQRMTSVPYAAAAGDAATLQGMSAADFLPAGAVLPTQALPTDGLGTISNNSVSNEFKNVEWAFGGGPQDIEDLPGPGGSASVTTSETGDSYLSSLTIELSYSLSILSTLRITLYPPLSSGLAPIVLFEGLQASAQYDKTWTPGSTPALAPLIGTKVEGVWAIEITDLDDTAGAGVKVGKLLAFSVTYDVVRSDHLAVHGRLDVQGNAYVMGNLDVSGAVQAAGPITGQYQGVSFYCSSHGQLAGWQKYCASNVQWNSAPSVFSVAASGEVAVSKAGFYRLEAYADQLRSCAGGAVQLRIMLNGSNIRGWEHDAPSGRWLTQSISHVVRAQAGDTIALEGHHGCSVNEGYAYHLGPYWSNAQITYLGSL